MSLERGRGFRLAEKAEGAGLSNAGIAGIAEVGHSRVGALRAQLERECADHKHQVAVGIACDRRVLVPCVRPKAGPHAK
jgi:hypothetical protein